MEITEILSRIDAQAIEQEAKINGEFALEQNDINQKVAELESERDNINIDSETEKKRIRDAYSTIIGTKLKIKEGTNVLDADVLARNRILNGIDRNANAKRAEIDAKIEEYNTQLLQRKRESEVQLQDARQNAEQDKQKITGAYLDIDVANNEIKNIDEEVQKIQDAIEGLEKDKKACEEEIRKLQGRYVQGENGELTKTGEQVEYENELQQIESELASRESELSALKDRKSVEESVLATANQTIQAMLEKYPGAEKNKDEEQKPEPVVGPEPTIEAEVAPTPEPVEQTIPTPIVEPEPAPEITTTPEQVSETVEEPRTHTVNEATLNGEYKPNEVEKAALYAVAKELFKEVTEQEKIEIANGNFEVFNDIWKRIDEEPIAFIEEQWKEMAKEELGIDDKNSIARRIFSVLSQTEKEDIANEKMSLVDVLMKNHPNEANEYFLLTTFEIYKLRDKISVMCQKECSKEKQETIGEPKTPEDKQNKEKEKLTNDEIVSKIFGVLTEEEKKDIAAFGKRGKGTNALDAIMYYEHSDFFKQMCDAYSDEIIDLVECKAAMKCEWAYPIQEYTDEELKQLMNKAMDCRKKGSIMEQEDWKVRWMDEWLRTEQKQAPAAPKQAPAAPKQAPAAPKQAPAAPKQTPAAPKQAPVAPKQTPVAPKQTPVAPKQAPAAPKQTPVAPKQIPTPLEPTPKKIDYEKISIGVDKNGTIMDIEGKASYQSIEGTYTALLARRKVISVENIDTTILANAEAKGDKFIIEEILTNQELESKQKEEILKAYAEMIELRQADPKADIFRQKSMLDLHYDLRKIDEAYLSDTEREELISKAREADKLKIAKVKAGPQLRVKWIWEDIKARGRNLKNKFWNKNKAMPAGGIPVTVKQGNTQESETLPPPIPPKSIDQEVARNGHQIFAEGLGNTTYGKNDETLPGMFEDFRGLTPDEQENQTTHFTNLKFGGNYDPVTPVQQGEEAAEEEYEIIE